MAYEMVMPYHLHMPSYFLETFTEYPYLVYGVNEHECIDRSIKSSQIYNIKSIIFLFRLYFLTLAF